MPVCRTVDYLNPAETQVSWYDPASVGTLGQSDSAAETADPEASRFATPGPAGPAELLGVAGVGPRSTGLSRITPWIDEGQRSLTRIRAAALLRLQTQIGNRAVARLTADGHQSTGLGESSKAAIREHDGHGPDAADWAAPGRSPEAAQSTLLHPKLQRARSLQRDTEVKPDGPWWQSRADWVRAAVGRGDFVNYTNAPETAGAYWIINGLNTDDQAKIMTFLDASTLDALLDYDEKAAEAGIPNVANIVAQARKARALRQAPQRDPLKVMVPGTWVDDFKEVGYDINYRIDEGGSPSEWIQVHYKDGTQIDLNWYDFEDAKLLTDDMKAALQNRFLGAGRRVFPGRTPTNPGRPGYKPRYALTQQLCPRLWAMHKEVEEIGAESTIALMQLSLTAVMVILTMPAMPVGLAPETAVTPSRVTRRVVLRSNRISVGQAANMEAAFRQDIRNTRDMLVKIPGSTKEVQGGVGPVLSGCLDKQSGEISYAVNQGKIPERMHPLLKARYEAYLQGAGGTTPPTAGVPGAHSEIGALNKALWARDPAGTMTAIPEGEFTMHNASLYRNRPEGVPPMCTNCSGIVPPEVKFLQ